MLFKAFTTSKNGTADVLSAADVVSIIQACKDSNVKSIRFGGLAIDLGKEESQTELVQYLPTPDSPSQEELNPEPPNQELLDAFEAQQLLINNPDEYERKYVQESI